MRGGENRKGREKWRKVRAKGTGKKKKIGM